MSNYKDNYIYVPPKYKGTRTDTLHMFIYGQIRWIQEPIILNTDWINNFRNKNESQD